MPALNIDARKYKVWIFVTKQRRWVEGWNVIWWLNKKKQGKISRCNGVGKVQTCRIIILFDGRKGWRVREFACLPNRWQVFKDRLIHETFFCQLVMFDILKCNLYKKNWKCIHTYTKKCRKTKPLWIDPNMFVEIVPFNNKRISFHLSFNIIFLSYQIYIINAALSVNFLNIYKGHYKSIKYFNTFQ